MSVTAKQFYRRQLPSTCIDFASELGKKLFKESLLDGTAEVYFKLAAQFRTQDEPAFCGLSTLVMVLNALEVDPGRVWKAPWRFYHESMLDCCVPLENVKRTGINMDQFNCLANCNRLHCSVSYAQETPQYLDEFRRSVESSVKSDKQIIVVSYDRSVLGQTGSGHFSPLAAYHRSTDSVLIMDVARFKYPPHWVSLQLLQQAMYSIDKSSKKHRGYLELSLREGTRPLVMFGLKANISTNDANFANSAIIWKEFLLCDVLADPDEEFQLSCRKFGQCFAPHALCCTQKIMDQNDKKTCCKESAECQLEACQQICTEMRKTKFASVFASGAVAALMIAWPYEMGYSERNDKLAQQANEEKSRFSIDTRNEIDQLSVQLSMLIACSKPPPILDRTKSTTSRCSRAVVTNGTTEPCSCQNDVHL